MSLEPKRAFLVLVGVVLAFASTSAWPQNEEEESSSPQQTELSTTDQQPNPTQSPASSGETPPYRTNPPIIGFNLRHFVPNAENRSFLIPGAQVSQGLYSNQQNGFGNSDFFATTRGLGSLSFQEVRHRYDLGVDYVGGIAYLGNRPLDHAWLQSLDADEHMRWRRGEFAVHDSFSYLPEGTFGAGAYGGIAPLSSLGAGLAGGLLGLGIFGSGQFATLGEQPRITNVSLADVTQYLSARSAVSAAGAYGLVHFTGSHFDLINSHQVVAQGAYNHELTRKDQVAVIYAYQELRFPSSIENKINTQIANLLYGHRVSGRMQFIAGAGPQFTHIDSPLQGSINRTTIGGRAALSYQYRPTTEFAFRFFRYNTNGSGFFAGATTNVLRFSANHQFGRVWGVELDTGYSHNRALAPAIASRTQTFDYVYSGGGLHRQLGREFSAFMSYHFGYVSFNNTFCVTASSCGKTSQHEVAMIGLDWHPHPIRLD